MLFITFFILASSKPSDSKVGKVLIEIIDLNFRNRTLTVDVDLKIDIYIYQYHVEITQDHVRPIIYELDTNYFVVRFDKDGSESWIRFNFTDIDRQVALDQFTYIHNNKWNEFSFDPPHVIQLQSGNETRNIYILLKPVNGKGRCALSGVLLLNHILLLPNAIEINNPIQNGCPNASGIPDKQLSGPQPQTLVTLSIDSVENGSKTNSGFDGVSRASYVYRDGSIFPESTVSLTSSSRIDDKTSIFVVWLIINVVIVIVYGYFGLRKRISKMGMKEDPPTDEKTSDKEANC